MIGMVNDMILLITASPEIHVSAEMRQYPKIYIKSETLRLYKWLSAKERTTVHVADGCTGWLDESWDIFGVGNRQEHST